MAEKLKKIVFNELVRPGPGAHSNRKLFKRALMSMYDGADYAKHFFLQVFLQRLLNVLEAEYFMFYFILY